MGESGPVGGARTAALTGRLRFVTDGRTKLYGAGFGGIYGHVVRPASVCQLVLTSRRSVGTPRKRGAAAASRMKGALSPKKEMVGSCGGGTGAVFPDSLAAVADDGLDSPKQPTQMPGFDPVRDAVLNSPITRSPTLPRHHPPPSTSAATSPHNPTTPTAQAPRRATVAALLNDISPHPSSSFQLPPPPVRASSLAHILHPTPPDDHHLPPRFPSPEEKLSRVPSLARLSSEISFPDPFRVSSLPSGIIHPATGRLTPPQPEALFTPTADRAGSLFTPTVEQRGLTVYTITPTSPTSARSNLSRPSTSPSTSHRPPPSPVMPRPPAPRVRSPTPPRSPSPPPKPKARPYNPRRRTPAGSVLEPLTPDEMHFYGTQLGTGTRRLAKRKRSPSYELPDSQPLPKKSRDAGLVMDHCTSPSSFSKRLPLFPRIGQIMQDLK